jgi:uncharacterized membrane protein YobD (UPF0266 family)
MPRRHGSTLLAVPLLRPGRVDSVIFVVLIVILVYNNVTSHGALITMVIMRTRIDGFLSVLDPQPKIIFKTEGFFFGNVDKI